MAKLIPMVGALLVMTVGRSGKCVLIHHMVNTSGDYRIFSIYLASLAVLIASSRLLLMSNFKNIVL